MTRTPRTWNVMQFLSHSLWRSGWWAPHFIHPHWPRTSTAVWETDLSWRIRLTGLRIILFLLPASDWFRSRHVNQFWPGSCWKILGKFCCALKKEPQEVSFSFSYQMRMWRQVAPTATGSHPTTLRGRSRPSRTRGCRERRFAFLMPLLSCWIN